MNVHDEVLQGVSLDAVTDLLGSEYQALFASQRKAVLDGAGKNAARVERLAEAGKAVMGHPQAKALMKELVAMVFLNPAYPPPSGEDPAAYAAQRAGQQNIVSLLMSFMEA